MLVRDDVQWKPKGNVEVVANGNTIGDGWVTLKENAKLDVNGMIMTTCGKTGS